MYYVYQTTIIYHYIMFVGAIKPFLSSPAAHWTIYWGTDGIDLHRNVLGEGGIIRIDWRNKSTDI